MAVLSADSMDWLGSGSCAHDVETDDIWCPGISAEIVGRIRSCGRFSIGL